MARLWLFLAPAYAIGHLLFLFLVCRTIDLRPEVAYQYGWIPFLQAGVLTALTSRFRLRLVQSFTREMGRSIFICLLWFIQGALLFIYWTHWWTRDLTNILALLSGIEALAAGGIFLFAKWAGKSNSRLTLLVFPFMLLALGSNAIYPWLDGVPALLPAGWPPLLRQAVVFWVLLFTIILTTGEAQDSLAERNPFASSLLGGTQVFVVISAIGLFSNIHLYASLMDPWRHIIVTSLFLAAGCALSSSLCLLQHQSYPTTEGSKTQPSQARRMGFWGLWFVLTLAAMCGIVLIRGMLGRPWDWSKEIWVPVFLLPLIQGAWLRWAREFHGLWKRLCSVMMQHPVLVIFCLCEVVGLLTLYHVQRPWKGWAIAFFLPLWLGMKLAIMGFTFIKRLVSAGNYRSLRLFCGAASLIAGFGTVATSYVPDLSILAATSGCLLALMGIRWQQALEDQGTRFVGGAAEALLMPLTVMILGSALFPENPLELKAHIAYPLLILVSSLEIMAMKDRNQGTVG